MVAEIRKETNNQKLIAKIAGGASMFQTSNDTYYKEVLGTEMLPQFERSLKTLELFPFIGKSYWRTWENNDCGFTTFTVKFVMVQPRNLNICKRE